MTTTAPWPGSPEARRAETAVPAELTEADQAARAATDAVVHALRPGPSGPRTFGEIAGRYAVEARAYRALARVLDHTDGLYAARIACFAQANRSGRKAREWRARANRERDRAAR